MSSSENEFLITKNYDKYMLSNMRRLKDENVCEAKAWLVTARSLFPNDFNIQYESYKMVRDYKIVKEAAAYFAELMEKFPGKSELLNEMQKMTDSLNTNAQFADSVFTKTIFQNLSDDQKSKVLTLVANRCEEPMKHCTLMLLLLKELPSQLQQHGEKVINTLLISEKYSHCEYPVNPFRKLLVCEALPLILLNPNFKINFELLFYLMQALMEFFVSYIFTSGEEDLDSEFSNIIKDNKLTSNIAHKVWRPLFILLKAGGQQLKWTLVDMFLSQNNLLNEMNWELILSTIHAFYVGDHTSLVSNASFDSNHKKEVFICVVVIYFYSLYQFTKIINPRFFLKTVSTDVHYVLIEGIHTPSEPEIAEPFNKKMKYEHDLKRVEKNPSITVSYGMSADLADQVTQSFIMSSKIWDFIHQNPALTKEFSALNKVIEMDKWPCFQEFYIDMLMYQSCHNDTINRLMHIIQTNNDEFVKNKARFQLASCFNYIGEYMKACECLFDIICSFLYPYPISNNSDIKLPPARSVHHLYFIPHNPDVILNYCVELLICIYKKKLKVDAKESVLLGHIVILCQYKWPREEEFFLHCTRAIQRNKSFCYGKFFDYVIVPSILEEFMYLTTSEGGNVILDLLPTSTMQIGKQRVITRGVDRGAKDDLKDSMRKQMSRCEENLNELLITFIQRERYCIKRIIM